MINGKRVEVLAVALNGQVLLCEAPYMSSVYPGDQVIIEGKAEFGTVLLKDRMELTGEDHERISRYVQLHRVNQQISFTAMNWSGYEEEDDE